MHCPARYSCFICHLQHRQHQRHLSPPLPPVTQWETWARHIRAPRTWLHHIYVYKKKIRTWCRETPGNHSSATAPAGGRHEEGSCTPSPRELQCQHHTRCPGSLTHTKTPQVWCCQCHFSPWHVPTPRTGSGEEDAVIELSQVRRALGCKWNGGLFFIRYLFCIPYDCFSQHPLV